MRREVVLLLALGLALSAGSCRSPECPEVADCEECVACVPDPDLAGDIVSGCEDLPGRDQPAGSPLVKALITLDKGNSDKCRASVEPREGVCVVQGGVIRWKVDNRCGPLEGSRDDPAIAVTELVLETTAKDGTTTETPATWLFDACEAQIPTLEEGAPAKKNMLLCDVPTTTDVGKYKYKLGGKFEALDPPIRVRPPRDP
jgi:hypothetical protein